MRDPSDWIAHRCRRWRTPVDRKARRLSHEADGRGPNAAVAARAALVAVVLSVVRPARDADEERPETDHRAEHALGDEGHASGLRMFCACWGSSCIVGPS